MMDESNHQNLLERALQQGEGVLRLAPAWVPRAGNLPGRRLRLHPDDLYPWGSRRGGITERWLSSTAKAENGPLTPPDEGLSYIVSDGERLTLRDALELNGPALIGQSTVDTGGWVMFGKLFDCLLAIPLHMHPDDRFAALVGQRGKPEAYFYPAQYNPFPHSYPFTYFGLLPGTTTGQVIDHLKRWIEDGVADNQILALSSAHQLTLGTGWYVPPGVLHAPGSLCTYEPQRTSDVGLMFQSQAGGILNIGPEALWNNVPAEHRGDYKYVIEMLDWATNLDGDFKAHHFLTPRPCREPDAMHAEGYHENWITYNNPYFSAKELTVYPGRTVMIRDAAAYGLLCAQGYGRFGALPISSPSLVRYGEMTEDEFFVTVSAAQAGIQITNSSSTEPLVLLKHFNPDNPDLAALPNG